MGKKTDLTECCAHCGSIECINLFRHTKDTDKLVGGELYVYKQLTHSKIINEELTKHVCSNGVLLQCACFTVTTSFELFPEHYLTKICSEVVRDMKASFYLAMSGHYRQAIIMQRCVFEYFLYGLYFHAENYFFSKDSKDHEDVQKNFMSWIDGGFRKSDSDLLDIIQRGGLITKAEKKEWKTLFKELSQFVHTILKTPTGRTIKHENFEIRTCYAEVEFNKDSLTEWSKYYQKVLFLVLYKLFTLYPFVKKEDAGKLALKLIRADFKDLRQELNNPYLDEILKMRGGKGSYQRIWEIKGSQRGGFAPLKKPLPIPLIRGRG